MKDNVKVIFSDEQFNFLNDTLMKCSQRSTNGLPAIAGCILAGLEDCSKHNPRANTEACENSVITEFYNDHASELILLLLDELYQKENGKSSEEPEPQEIYWADGLEMLINKAAENVGGKEKVFENSDILTGVFSNAAISVVRDEETKSLKTFVTNNKPYCFSEKLDIYD